MKLIYTCPERISKHVLRKKKVSLQIEAAQMSVGEGGIRVLLPTWRPISS